MKIIMLSGNSSCGKTTTLNKVYEFINPTIENIIKEKSKLGGDPKDFECIIKYNGKTVAFFTMGDFSSYLIKAFERYDKMQCDFLICACNTHFTRPYQKIKKYSNLIIDKKPSNSLKQNDIEFANNFDKEKIVAELNRL